jgi:hypothetical protein
VAKAKAAEFNKRTGLKSNIYRSGRQAKNEITTVFRYRKSGSVGGFQEASEGCATRSLMVLRESPLRTMAAIPRKRSGRVSAIKAKIEKPVAVVLST